MTEGSHPQTVDAYKPAEMARLVEAVGVTKAGAALLPTLMLAVLAGAFISLGGIFYALVMTGSGLGFGPGRMLGGLAFSLGLILVVVGGAELFTGNNLIVMAWASRKVSTARLLRNWVLVYLGNLAGSLGMVVLVLVAGTAELGQGGVGETLVAIARGKVALGFWEALARGILCNLLVCLAVWLCFAAHEVAGKILAIVFPITAFVALGFEHSVANMFLIPLGLAVAGEPAVLPVLKNLLPVTLGNILGGGLFVALTYWIIYILPTRRGHPSTVVRIRSCELGFAEDSHKIKGIRLKCPRPK